VRLRFAQNGKQILVLIIYYSAKKNTMLASQLLKAVALNASMAESPITPREKDFAAWY